MKMCEVHSCRTFARWLHHRMQLLGIHSYESLADVSGISPSTIKRIVERGTLQRVGRSARGYLARTLEVSIRELEEIACGKTEWIDDRRRMDWSRLTPDPLRTRRTASAEDHPRPIAARAGRGVPIVGRIHSDGAAQLLEETMWGDLPRLPVRYTHAPDAFALRLLESTADFNADEMIVFRGTPPGELCPRQSALLTRGDHESETIFCRIETRSEQGWWICLPGGKRDHVSLDMILRAAHAIGCASQDVHGTMP